MIRLKLSFGKNDTDREFDIVQGELLSSAVERAAENIPRGKHELHEMFNVTVNGHIINKDLWAFTKLIKDDTVLLSPKISGGDSGQLFKQFAIIAITLAAGVYIAPTGILGAMGVAAVSVGATLLLNALIPPPVPNVGDFNSGGVDKSQMYAISGQSNEMRRLGTVPKVYGSHRMFPILAATPYTELSTDPDTGETIQTLYAIYDFGLGTMDVQDIRIGDTPLTRDTFADYDVRLIDPNKPEVSEDDFDDRLENEFLYYKTSRVITQLAIELNEDGDESIQNSDENSEGHPQEIILDFVAPRGLYGFNSNGTKGSRNVQFEIHFALVGTTDWRSYNDPDYTDSFSLLGGKSVDEFYVQFASDGIVAGTYYNATLNDGFIIDPLRPVRNFWAKKGQNKLKLVSDSRIEVGMDCFYWTRHYLGKVVAITSLGGGASEITLNRNITSDYVGAYHVEGERATVSGPITWGDPQNHGSIRFLGTASGTARITGDSTYPVYAQVRFTPTIAGQYQIRVRRILESGNFVTQHSDDITWGALTTAYKVAPINTTKRHCFLELKIRATDQLNGHIQNLSAVVTSVLPVYDPDTETWTRLPTSNPAWIFCDLLTGEVNKKPISRDRLHLDSIVDWADFCEEIPDPPPSATYTRSRFTSNFILDYDATLQTVLNQVCSAAQASINIIDGQYGVLVDRLQETPVQIFTPRNSKDFSSTRLYGPRPHGLKIKFIDPDLNWDISEVIVYDNGYTEETATEFEELTAFACTNYEQAWRFGRYMIAQNKLRQETISLTVDFENLICTRGDYVQITQDVMRVGGRPARVKEVSGVTITIDDSLDIDPDLDYGYTYRSTATGDITTDTLTVVDASTFDVDGDVPEVGDLIVIGEVGSIVYDCIVKSISPNDDMSANLILTERAAEIYDYESTDTLAEYDPQLSEMSRPDFYPPKAVTNLEVTDNFWECSETLSGYNYYVELLWDMPAGSVFEYFEVWVNDGRGYRLYDTTTSKLYKYYVDQGRLDIEHGFKIAAVSASGKKLELIAMSEVTATPTTKTDPPSDVESLSMMITNQVLQLTWPPIDDCDCAEYTLRFSPDTNDVWEQSIPLVTVSKDVNSVAVQARTGVYLIKAIDFAGNQSDDPAIATTTIPNLFDLNVIEEIDEAPDFTGVLYSTELLGEAVILEEQVPGNVDTVVYYTEGYYEYSQILDLSEVYSVRLQSQIRADGLKKGELMSEWEELQEVENLNTALHSDWNATLQYRASNVFAAMSDWAALEEVDHLNFGAGVGFTEWRDVTTVGDATGQVFQFRVKLESFTANVTPRLFDATVKADMPDRIDSDENLTSHPSEAYDVTYTTPFKGPGTSPNVQISIDDADTGDYWTFDSKTLEGFSIRFYDSGNNQVSRQFDWVAKGYGRLHTVSL